MNQDKPLRKPVCELACFGVARVASRSTLVCPLFTTGAYYRDPITTLTLVASHACPAVQVQFT